MTLDMVRRGHVTAGSFVPIFLFFSFSSFGIFSESASGKMGVWVALYISVNRAHTPTFPIYSTSRIEMRHVLHENLFSFPAERNAAPL